MKEYDYESLDDDEECYQECRQEFIYDSRQTVNEELRRQGLPQQDVYIVSQYTLRKAYSGLLEGSRSRKRIIHEMKLIDDLMRAAQQRRCGPGRDPISRLETNIEIVYTQLVSQLPSLANRVLLQRAVDCDKAAFSAVKSGANETQRGSNVRGGEADREASGTVQRQGKGEGQVCNISVPVQRCPLLIKYTVREAAMRSV